MYSKPQHKVDEGLKKFELIAGVGDGEKTACAMSMLGWLAGHKNWSDAPVCAHDELSEMVIGANDWEDDNLPRLADTYELTKRGEERLKARRANLVKLGYDGVLDTWWIPKEIINWAKDIAEYDEGENPYKHAVEVLKTIAKWKKTRHKMQEEYVQDKNAKNGQGWKLEWVRAS